MLKKKSPGALTNQTDDAMALYVPFRRGLGGHTSFFYGPLEEENAGHERCKGSMR